MYYIFVPNFMKIRRDQDFFVDLAWNDPVLHPWYIDSIYKNILDQGNQSDSFRGGLFTAPTRFEQ